MQSVVVDRSVNCDLAGTGVKRQQSRKGQIRTTRAFLLSTAYLQRPVIGHLHSLDKPPEKTPGKNPIRTKTKPLLIYNLA